MGESPRHTTMTVDNAPKVATEVEIDEYKVHESNSNTIKSRWVKKKKKTYVFGFYQVYMSLRVEPQNY